MGTSKSMAMVGRIFFLVFAFSVVLGLAASVSAATFTVKQLGGGDFTTISAAIPQASPDDTILVYPGRYEEVVFINKNLTLIGAGPQFTSIYHVNDAMVVNNNITATIIGFTITSLKSGIIIRSGADVKIKNNVIVNNISNGIYIEKNSFVSIINNTISFNNGDGIYIYEVFPNIINNIVSNNGAYGINYKQGSGDYCWSGTYYIAYNNLSSNLSGNYRCTPNNTGGISQSPLFIDSSIGNFILKSTSPCKNAGRPGDADLDPDGSRNDMGAYGGPDAASFWPYPPGAPVITNITSAPTSVQRGGTITINATGEVK